MKWRVLSGRMPVKNGIDAAAEPQNTRLDASGAVRRHGQ